jgi:hypothetical protein
MPSRTTSLARQKQQRWLSITVDYCFRAKRAGF